MFLDPTFVKLAGALIQPHPYGFVCQRAYEDQIRVAVLIHIARKQME
jgi:hypothetical protein